MIELNLLGGCGADFSDLAPNYPRFFCDIQTKFWDQVHERLIDKATIRDGYRHLPDDQTSLCDIYQAYVGLFATACINIRAIKAIVDSIGWNEFLLGQNTIWSRKNRRTMEIISNLHQMQVPSIATLIGCAFPPVAQYDGGPFVATWANMYPYAVLLGANADANHPAFVDHDVNDIPDTSGEVDDWLAEIENAVSILNFLSTIPSIDRTVSNGFTWTATGRGARDDLRYARTLLHELVFPSGLPDVGQITSNALMFNQLLYGEALYGADVTLTLGVESSREIVGYPHFLGDSSEKVYRRGFLDGKDALVQMGLYNTYMIGDSDYYAFYLGLTTQIADNSKDTKYGLAYAVGIEGSTTLTVITDAVAVDDATTLRSFLEGHSPLIDHQWVDSLFLQRDGHTIHTPSGIASYGYFMPVDLPMEAFRAALCATFNIPYQR